MSPSSIIVVTGAAGFIGSCLVRYLNERGYVNLVLVDDFSRADKRPNLENKQFIAQVEREIFFDWLEEKKPAISFVFHIGARTDTTEFDYAVHLHLNLEYSQKIWQYCTENQVPLVYASSAATYGNGEFGYHDNHEVIYSLQPLNPYGVSKNEFDKWAVGPADAPPFWAGLKFFNVYGPNEYHKGRMASVIFHAFNQIRKTGSMQLFRSHRPEYLDGQQLRDFVYVMDVVEICYWLMLNAPKSGLYNLGTGIARSFADLVTATFTALGIEPVIKYIDMPEDIRTKYQYFTEADMTKLSAAGYQKEFYTLEKGVGDYVSNYLVAGNFY